MKTRMAPRKKTETDKNLLDTLFSAELESNQLISEIRPKQYHTAATGLL